MVFSDPTSCGGGPHKPPDDVAAAPAPAAPPQPERLSLTETAQFLGVSYRRALGWILRPDRHRLPAYQPGGTKGKYIVLRSELMDWLRLHRAGATAQQIEDQRDRLRSARARTEQVRPPLKLRAEIKD